MWLSVCFPGSPGSTAARLGPASVRMACSVVPPSHLIACILPTEPPIQPGLQDRITKKKFSVWEGGSVHLQARVRPNLHVPGEKAEVESLSWTVG